MAEEPTTENAKRSPAQKRKKSAKAHEAAATAKSGPRKASAAEQTSAVDQAFEQAARYAWMAPLVVIVAALVTGQIAGFGLGLLVAAGGTLLVVIGLLWASLQGLTEDSPLSLEEALSLGAPSAEEEKKRAVLRTLKDLDFERGVGKISEEDYRQLSSRYRAEARNLLRALDGDLSKAREDATALMEAHFIAEGIEFAKPTSQGEPDQEGAPSEPVSDEDEPSGDKDGPSGDEDEDEDELESDEDLATARTDESTPDEPKTAASAEGEPVDDPVDRAERTRNCDACDTVNDDDARFCKGCGATLEEA